MAPAKKPYFTYHARLQHPYFLEYASSIQKKPTTTISDDVIKAYNHVLNEDLVNEAMVYAFRTSKDHAHNECLVTMSNCLQSPNMIEIDNGSQYP
ncbi:hypothetical protein BGZ46_006459 [Entomortierella lignicola]|nr:hypothetical protein BGZ46_006459 [Entomortierella lignicola]